ncbi:MAG TPA: Gfo/Idh/MocA family oxidoreductase [Thermomicrobiales bacterium]|nr:Gfo/Idh/MocA family oxidoreductase [Thermomicrobiales bacterium]
MSAYTDSAFRVAIVGSGMIGTVHRDAARAAGADIIGVLGSSPDRSHQVAAEWGVARGYADIDELLSDRPDVVHVCTPNDTHFSYSQAVIAAGIHIICEKPLAISTAQAQELADAAHAAHVIATVPFVYRYQQDEPTRPLISAPSTAWRPNLPTLCPHSRENDPRST